MSAKTHFLKKLQGLQPSCGTFGSKTEADIAAFRQRLTQLHTRMDAWLKETGIGIESTSVSLIDLLVGQRAFEVPGIILRYENRRITFTPLFFVRPGRDGMRGGEPLCRREYDAYLSAVYARGQAY